jgi:Txe/YoeB family toxin of Txe-Axe toxin-antitoxin module
METFTSLENRLQVLSKSLKSLKKIEADNKKAYDIIYEKLINSQTDVRQKEIEIEPLKNSLKDLYSKKLDILTR